MKESKLVACIAIVFFMLCIGCIDEDVISEGDIRAKINVSDLAILPITESPVENNVIAWKIVAKEQDIEISMKSLKTASDLNKLVASIEAARTLRDRGCKNIKLTDGRITTTIGNSAVVGFDGEYAIISRQSKFIEELSASRGISSSGGWAVENDLGNGVVIESRPAMLAILYGPSVSGKYRRAKATINLDGVSVQKIEELNKFLAQKNVTLRF